MDASCAVRVEVSMFAEQLPTRKPAPIIPLFEKPRIPGKFTLSPNYQREHLHEKLQEISEKEIRQFDIGYSLKDIDVLIARFGKERGLFHATMGVLLNIWTLRQEMLASMDTHEIITLVVKDREGKTKFSNNLYGSADDIEKMYAKYTPPAYLRDRFALESNQIIFLFKKLARLIEPILLDAPSERLVSQLVSYGFHEEEIDVSPSMCLVVPSLFEQIQSVDDLLRVIGSKRKMKVLISPAQAVTVSTPHWSHRKGESGLVWASELVVIPQTGETFIRQNGKFGKTTEEELVKFLGFRQQIEKEFQTSEEMMMFINFVMESGYRQPKALLDFLVSHVGKIRPATKIDRHIQEGNFDIKPYFEGIYEILTLEYENLVQHRNLPAILARLSNLSDLIKHQIARNNPKALPALVEEYKDQVKLHPYASDAQAFQKKLTAVALKVDPGFRIQIDFSLLDCTAGSVMNLVNGNSLSNLQASLGVEKFNSLLQLEGKSIADRSQFEKIARQFGKDPGRFKEWGVCKNPNCTSGRNGLSNYLGECGWCLACEVKDDLGIHSDLGTLSQNEEVPGREGIARTSSSSMGASAFLASMTNRAVFEDYFVAAA